MKERIDKERLHLFAPRDILVTHVEVEGIIFIEKLKELDASGELSPTPTWEKPAGNGDFNSPAYKG